MRKPRPRLKYASRLLLIVVGLTQASCSIFGYSPTSSRQTVSRNSADSFELEIPRPVYNASSKGAVPDSAVDSRLPGGFQLKSFVENIFAQRVTPVSEPDKPARDVASIKRLPTALPDPAKQNSEQNRFCQKLDRRLSSISLSDCMASPLSSTGHYSIQGQPILRTRFDGVQGVKPTGRVLLIGGVHGDELSAVSIVFEWLQYLRDNHDGEFIWDVVPVMNPDGFFAADASRTNANGVDLNRNMPTTDWAGGALRYWRERAKGSPRKFPGDSPGSEPETRWLVAEIDHFKPDMIITVHAPYNLIDYDAPSRKNAPRRFGRVKGGLLGTYPGSLGNYAGVKRGIPVVTIELPSANRAMSEVQAHDMWADMLSWLGRTIPLENERFMKNRRYATRSGVDAL